jgi:uncharacterized membrane protein YedE/YeeE
MQIIASFIVGLIFGLGLLLSRMSDPAKVLGLVMAGAIAVGLPVFAIASRRRRSLLGAEMKLPTSRQIDGRLIGGSLLFGIGWGIAGFCPGPALVALSIGGWKATTFVLAMIAGMGIFEWLQRRSTH